jgi:hypothetical protein
VARTATRRVFRTFRRLEFILVWLLWDNLDTREWYPKSGRLTTTKVTIFGFFHFFPQFMFD